MYKDLFFDTFPIFSESENESYAGVKNEKILLNSNNNNNIKNEKNIIICPYLSKNPIIKEAPLDNLTQNNLNENNNGNINLNSNISNSNIIQYQDINLKPKERKNKEIFKIYKDNKNKGRIKKSSNLIGKHNKFSEDNIIRKIKGRFHEKVRLYINKEYKRYLIKHKHDIKKIKDLLQRITPRVSRKIKRDENLKWLKSKLYQVYSENVSIKCSLYEPDYNKKQIEKLFREDKAKNVIDILNKPIKEMFLKFCNNIKVEGFKTLNEDLKELKQKLIEEGEENINEYLKKYENVAKNMENIFINKNSRNNYK